MRRRRDPLPQAGLKCIERGSAGIAEFEQHVRRGWHDISGAGMERHGADVPDRVGAGEAGELLVHPGSDLD